MNRERPETGKKPTKPGTPARHLDLAWSSPASPWETTAPLAAPQGATVPALDWSDPWPPIRSAQDKPVRDAGDVVREDVDGEKPDAEDAAEVQDEHEDLDEQDDAGESEDLEAAAPVEGTDEDGAARTAEGTDADQLDAEQVDEDQYPESDFDDLAELDEIAFPGNGLPRSTWLLGIGALVALSFGGGILIQKHHDSGLVNPAALAAAQLQQAQAAGAAGPALAGTVTAVSPTDFTVKDAQGGQHKVAVTDATPIVKKLSLKDSAKGSNQGLVNGSQVIVQGTSDADGTLQASAVVVQ